jgi:hypothetical protein
MQVILIAALAATTLTANPGPIKIDELSLGKQEFYSVTARASEYPSSDKFEASLAVADDGKIAVAWQSRRQLAGKSGVYTRIFDKTGLSIGGEIHASGERRFHESKPSVVYSAKPLAFYQSAWRDDSGAGVYANSLAAETTKGDQTDIVATKLKDGTILATWSSQISRRESRIFGRMFDSAGNPTGKEFRLSGKDSGNELLPSVTADAKGALVVWQSLDDKGNLEGIWGRRLSAGDLTGAARQIIPGEAFEPSVSRAGERYAIAWIEADSHGKHKVHAALLDNSLTKTTELPIADQDGYQNAAAISGREDGAVAIAWNLVTGDDPAVIYLSLFDPTGRSIGRASKLHGGAIAQVTGTNRLSWTPTGGLALAWSGDSGLGDSKAANLTLLLPKPAVSETMLGGLRSLAEREFPKPEPRAVTDVEGIRFAAEAGPHEPPSYNPKVKLDPWGTEPIEDGASGFNAVVNTGWTPPDPHMAVGPNHVGVMTNGQIAFFTKNGQNTFRDEIEDNFGFWGVVGATNFVFDPEIVYDDFVDRWFAMCCERGSDGRSYFLLAVSGDSDPNGSWFKYRIDVTNVGGGGDIDSPNISTDENCVYLSADFFTPQQKYLVFILSKADLIVGDPTPTTRSHLITGTQSHGMPMMMSPGAPQYLIEHFEAASNTTVRLHAITDPLGTPTRTTFTLNVPAYGRPEDPPQAGSSSRPETFDSRFWSCVYRNGSLWATHHINSARVVARWYEIKMNNWPNGGTPTLVQSGDIDPGGTVRTTFSSIAVDAQGNAAVVCARSSPSEFFSMYRAMRKASDPLGTMPDQAIVQTTTGPYTAGRWGDYSAVVVDPADNRTFWGHHEYAINGSWRTWVESFAATLLEEERAVEQIIPILAGTIVGGLPEIAAADGTFMSVGASPLSPNNSFCSSVDYIATSGVADPDELDIRTVARAATGTGRVEIYLLNRQTSVYDFVGSGNVNSASFTTITVPAGGDPSRYVDPGTRQMRMRMVFSLGLQPSATRPPLHVDEVKFITRF